MKAGRITLGPPDSQDLHGFLESLFTTWGCFVPIVLSFGDSIRFQRLKTSILTIYYTTKNGYIIKL